MNEEHPSRSRGSSACLRSRGSRAVGRVGERELGPRRRASSCGARRGCRSTRARGDGAGPTAKVRTMAKGRPISPSRRGTTDGMPKGPAPPHVARWGGRPHRLPAGRRRRGRAAEVQTTSTSGASAVSEQTGGVAGDDRGPTLPGDLSKTPRLGNAPRLGIMTERRNERDATVNDRCRRVRPEGFSLRPGPSPGGAGWGLRARSRRPAGRPVGAVLRRRPAVRGPRPPFNCRGDDTPRRRRQRLGRVVAGVQRIDPRRTRWWPIPSHVGDPALAQPWGMWATQESGVLTRIDPLTNRGSRTLPSAAPPRTPAAPGPVGRRDDASGGVGGIT
jgi:hypothetical protein